jgi:hypothetical protein
MRSQHRLAVIDWREDAVFGRGMEWSWLWQRRALEVVLWRRRDRDGGLWRTFLLRL